MDAQDDLHFTEYDTRVAGYAVIVRDGRILLTWYNGEGRGGVPCWSLPGGGVDFDESVEDGILREAYEETGYRIELVRPLGTDSVTRTRGFHGRPFKSVRIFYEARVVGGTLGVVEVGGSTDKAEWLELAAMPQERYSDIVIAALEALAKR